MGEECDDVVFWCAYVWLLITRLFGDVSIYFGGLKRVVGAFWRQFVRIMAVMGLGL